jgi:hypothetical protein
MKKHRTISLIVAILLIVFGTISNPLLAQDSLTIQNTNPPPYPERSDTQVTLRMSRYEFISSLVILAFGLIVVILEIIIIRQHKIHPEEIIKFVTITLIIISTLYLITAGYSNDQIAPAIGLLGTVAGYLLGKIHTNIEKNEKNNINEN